MRQKVLVLGHDSRSFLSVIRSLGRGGLEVHVAWHQPDDPAARSRYLAKQHDLPHYREDDDRWKIHLIELLKREQFVLVIPCHDSCLVPLQQHRKDLEPHGRLYLLSDEAFAVFFDKIQTNELARSVGVRVPRERILTELHGVEAVVSEFTFPVVLKPRQSFNPESPGSRHEVRKAYTPDELNQWLKTMIGAGPVAVQENVRGRGVGVELLMKGGEPLMVFQHERVHEPPHGGGSSYRKSTTPNPELVDASVRLLKPLNYTGVAMVEFKVDSQTGQWAFIEVNGRFWGSLPLGLAAGADFPLALFQMLVEGRTEFPQAYRAGLCCRHWAADLEWLSANLRADRSDPTLTTRPLIGVIAETLKNVVLLRERSDTFVLDDPAPAWHELSGILHRKWSGLRVKLARRFLQTSRSRRALTKRFRERLRVARRVLFLCKGNICRSPYAAAVAAKQLGHRLEIDSAGYLPLPGRPSPKDAIATAATRGVDLTRHQSQVVTDSLVRRFDLVIVFDYANYQQFREHYPFARNRVFPLGAIRTEGPLFIEDPWSRGTEAFKTCYQEIDENLERLIEEFMHKELESAHSPSHAAISDESQASGHQRLPVGERIPRENAH